MLTLVVNMLLEWETGDVERVLWIDPLGNDVVMIQVDDAAAWPTIHAWAMLQDALEKQTVWTTHGDQYAVPSQSEEDIPVKHRQRRDQAWHIIQPLIAAGKDIFIAEKRGPLVATVAEQAGKTKTTVYGYLRRYWQGGQTRNALLPRYHNCGAPDQIRPDTERKRGRPSDLERAIGVRMGVNVDDQIRDYFRAGIRQFYETRQARSLKEAYQLTLEKFFHRGYEWQDGVAIPILPPAEELPTFRQFTYWYRKEQNLTHTVVSCKGERRFNSDHRALLGDSTQMAFGPGAVYQIDATIGDIYLVSALDRQRIIGKPIIYLVVDVFSRLIAGLSVSLEGPSWLGAMLALENATTDKVALN